MKTVDVLAFDTTQVTSDKNYSHPKWGGVCHPLASGAHPPAVIIRKEGTDDDLPKSDGSVEPRGTSGEL